MSKIKGRKKLPSKNPKRRRGSNVPAVPGIGGDERDRTADLLVANQALSQLSYIPMHEVQIRTEPSCAGAAPPVEPRRPPPLAPPLPGATPAHPNLVGLPGFEPGTSRLSGARSNQLSYRPGSLARASEAVEPRPLARPLPGIFPESIGNRKGRQTRCGKFISNRVRDGPSGPRPTKYRQGFYLIDRLPKERPARHPRASRPKPAPLQRFGEAPPLGTP